MKGDMRKMDYIEVKRELMSLIDIVDHYGNCELTDSEKMHLARNTAYAVSLLRHKYEITSAFFAASEIAAEKLYEEKKKKGKLFG